MSAKIINYNFRLNQYLNSLPGRDRLDRRQVNTLAVMMERSAALHRELEDIYEQAVVLLREEQVEDEMLRVSFDAIFNRYDLAADSHGSQFIH